MFGKFPFSFVLLSGLPSFCPARIQKKSIMSAFLSEEEDCTHAERRHARVRRRTSCVSMTHSLRTHKKSVPLFFLTFSLLISFPFLSHLFRPLIERGGKGQIGNEQSGSEMELGLACLFYYDTSPSLPPRLSCCCSQQHRSIKTNIP